MLRGDKQVAALLSARVIRAGDEWFLERRDGVRITARITPGGTLDVGGKEFTSPSTAAGAVLGTSTNGWKRWKFRDGDEDRYVDVLRSRAQ